MAVGGALAKSANLGALSIANYAVEASGTNQQKLPGVVKNWLNSKKEHDEARERAQDAERARVVRKLKMELLASGDVVQVPSRYSSRASSRLPRQLELVREHSADNLDDMPLNRFRDSNAKRGMIKTPAHAGAVFKDLDTPEAIRRQLQQPLIIDSPSRPPPFQEELEQSPYPPSDEDSGPHFGPGTSTSDMLFR